MLHISLLASLMIGCGDESQSVEEVSDSPKKTTPEKKVKVDPPNPVQDPLSGEASSSLLVTQAWFWEGWE